MSAETLTLRAQLDHAGFALDVSEDLDLRGVNAVFGPSGGGKTTLLRAIAGFESPRRGRIALGDETWLDTEARVSVAAHRRPIGFMFQDARLFGHLDVSGNLAFADRRSRPAGDGAFGRDEIVSALDLTPLLSRRIDALSGGERQRVALGRTLLTRPKLLLLDEPLSALDHERKGEILPYLEQLPDRFGIPTIYVSHSVEEVARLAERVLVLSDGRVQAYGPTASILERLDLQPITGRGESGSLVAAEIRAHDRRLALTTVDLGGDSLTMPILEGLEPGASVRLRIRARDVAIALERPERISIRNVLAATIDEIVAEEDGPYAELFLSLDRARIRARVTRASVEDLALTKGMRVFALIKSVSFESTA